MNNDVSAPGVLATEGTTLPPPRSFGGTSTLTVPVARRRQSAGDLLTHLDSAAAPSDTAACVHLTVVPADPTPVTLTL